MSHPENRFDNPAITGEPRDLALAAWHARRTRDVSGGTAPPKDSAAEFAAWWKANASRMSSLRHAVWQAWMAAIPDTKEAPVHKSRRLFEAWWQIATERPDGEDEDDKTPGAELVIDRVIDAESGSEVVTGKPITTPKGRA